MRRGQMAGEWRNGSNGWVDVSSKHSRAAGRGRGRVRRMGSAGQSAIQAKRPRRRRGSMRGDRREGVINSIPTSALCPSPFQTGRNQATAHEKRGH